MTAKILVVVGTRPEAIKLAPVALAAQDRPGLEPIVVSTGQHQDILAPMLATFGLAADIDLGIGRARQSLNQLAARALTALDEAIERTSASAVIVQGDTTTAMAGALAAFHRDVPVVHVEAGLRTADPRNPFPEEMNRRLIGRIASLHLAPTEGARATLLAEGVPAGAVLTTGNTGIDALLRVAGLPAESTGDERLDALLADPAARIVLVTAHRRESHGEPMRRTMASVRSIARRRPELAFVVPVHPNPAVRDVVTSELAGVEGVLLTEPLGYRPFIRAMQRSTLILTDSGGVQEEAPTFGKPVLVLRVNTERPEGVTAGTAVLVGTDQGLIESMVDRLLDDPSVYRRMATSVNPYGDGRAAQRVVQAVEHLLGLCDRLPEPSVAQGPLVVAAAR